MKTKDLVVKTTELVIEALDFANTHKLDINKSSDVKKIIAALNPDHAGTEDVKKLMKLLRGADTFIEADVARRRKVN